MEMQNELLVDCLSNIHVNSEQLAKQLAKETINLISNRLPMTFSEYQENVTRHAAYPLAGRNLIYPALGLAGEAGEFADKVKKHWRNATAEHIKYCQFEGVEVDEVSISSAMMSAESMPKELRFQLLRELGDKLWYIQACAKELGSSLEEVAKINVEKLNDRAARGVIKSSGDNR